MKGYVDHKADYQEMMARMRAEGQMRKIVDLKITQRSTDPNKEDDSIEAVIPNVLEPADEPPGGWDAYFATHVKKDIRCQMCGQMAAECRPFGPNHESICEECAAKDPETSELRWRELNPNG